MSARNAWFGVVGAMALAAALAFGTLPALADDAPGEDAGGGQAGIEQPSGDGSGDGGPAFDPDHPDRQEGDIYDGEIIDYNTDGLELSVYMSAGALTLEVGQSTTVSCIIDPHQGILHTQKNGDILYDTSAYATSSDPSVVRASYDLGSDTLFLEAYEPGTATVTVGATLVYAAPVSASVTVTVPEPAAESDDEYVGGVPGGQGDANTNVTNGTGNADNTGVGAGSAGGYDVPAAAVDSGSSAQTAAPAPEAQAAADVAEAPSVALYELEEVEPALNVSVSGISGGFVAGVGLVAIALMLFGGGETYASFKRRLA